MADSFCPTHFTNVNKTLDTIFKFHKGPVTHYVDNSTLADRFNRILLCHFRPRARRALLHPKRNFFTITVNVKYLHFYFLVNRDHFAGVPNSSPTHVCDVQQSINATEINKSTEVSDILYYTSANLTNFKSLHELFLALRSFLFDQCSTRNNNVSTGLINFQNKALDRTVAIVADVSRSPDIHLACWQEDVNSSYVDKEATFNLPEYKAGDNVILMDT